MPEVFLVVRGYQRKVIFLKNTDSEIFTEAYFIVDDRASEAKESDMVREANRIIEENLARGAAGKRGAKGVKGLLRVLLYGVPAFLLGGGLATLICLGFL